MSVYITALMTYLKSHTPNPDDWHKIALGWNWDSTHEPISWIIQQTECDRSTALAVYWYGGAGWYVQFENREAVPDWSLPNYDLIKDVEQRYVRGFYTRQEIAFDPHNDDGHDWTSEYGDEAVKQPIPALLRESLTGRIVTGYPEEGYPPQVIAQIENHNDG